MPKTPMQGEPVTDRKAESVQFSDALPEAVDEYYEDEVDEALEARPIFSIRTRILLSFTLIFLLAVASNVWMILKVLEVQRKIHFLEVSDNYLAEIQQARRYEKNYLLYGTNLDDALSHIHSAQFILSRNRSVIRNVLGHERLQKMGWQLNAYETMLIEISIASDRVDANKVEAQLRRYGSSMVSDAHEFVDREREEVDRLLLLAGRMPFVFLGVLMLLMIFVATFLTRQLLKTLSRFMAYTNRIADGDFSPITPQRKYQDEFSQLARAFNHMIRELDRRHHILVESHKLRAVGTLVAGVAHELNNPLNNIMLTGSMLQEDFVELDDEEKLEMLQDVIGETERSQKIVRNLLDFARESKATIQHLDIKEIVEKSLRLVHNQTKLAKVKLTTAIPEGLPPIDGDEQMLSQVFVNLVLNAVDVLPPGGEIRVLARESAQERGYVTVLVEDNGPGIPGHTLEQIFDPFFTTKKKGKGSGLGLSVSRGIVSKLGGFIRVKSTVGEGTTFAVLLPVTGIPSHLSAGEVRPQP